MASIPFNRTACILKRTLGGYSTRVAALVVQKEAGLKCAGLPRENQCSVLAKLWYDVEIVRAFRRTDFAPVPSVDVVLLRLRRRDVPRVPARERALYERSIRYAFGTWASDLRSGLRPLYTYRQWGRLAGHLCIPARATATHLTLEQWLGLYECLRAHVLEDQAKLVLRGGKRR